MNRFTKNYWENKYESLETGWDAGGPTTPFVELFKFVSNKSLRVLIPGCGHAYEGEMLHNLGFTNVTLLDFSENAKMNFLKRVPSFPSQSFVIGDFFTHGGEYDLIVEQTFFCALEPRLRSKYAAKMHQLLAPGGCLKGLLFNFELTEVGPPFGGSIEEYESYFSKHFELLICEPCLNSIKPRLGKELFIDFRKAER